MKRAVALLVLIGAVMPIPARAQTAGLQTAIERAQEVIAAEQAFAALAQRSGQWTAFRAFAAPDAVMFVPGPTPADQWLAGRNDPPQSVAWQPHRIIVSCDATLAASTGAVQFPGGLNGVYTTIWARQADGGWRWIADDGGTVERPLPTAVTPEVEVADCPSSEGPDPQGFVPATEGRGASRDATLLWDWQPGASPGLRVSMWVGVRFAPIILQGPPQP